MKYEKIGYGITVAVKNNYLVRANILKVRDYNNTYNFTLELSKNTTERFIPFSDTEIYRMKSENINSDVADYILHLERENKLDSLIKFYEDLITYERLGRDIIALSKTFSISKNGEEVANV